METHTIAHDGRGEIARARGRLWSLCSTQRLAVDDGFGQAHGLVPELLRMFLVRCRESGTRGCESPYSSRRNTTLGHVVGRSRNHFEKKQNSRFACLWRVKRANLCAKSHARAWRWSPRAVKMPPTQDSDRIRTYRHCALLLGCLAHPLWVQDV